MEATIKHMKDLNQLHLKFSYCHQDPKRSFFYKGKQFPLCARCTGIHIGYFALFVFTFNFAYLGWLASFALILPTYTDGWLQAYTSWESKNWLRFTTGLAAGVGIMSVASLIGKAIGHWLSGLIF